MGASESSLKVSADPDEGITTISERIQSVDPVVQRLQCLKTTKPILTSNLAESSFSDILVRRSPSSSTSTATVDPNALLDIFSVYRELHDNKAQKIIEGQNEIENKIEVADALAMKLLQRFNFSVSAMKTSSNHLLEVDALQVELGELKGRLTEVMSNCDALCKRIACEGPESLRSSVDPFIFDQATNGSSTSTASMEQQEDHQPPATS